MGIELIGLRSEKTSAPPKAFGQVVHIHRLERAGLRRKRSFARREHLKIPQSTKDTGLSNVPIRKTAASDRPFTPPENVRTAGKRERLGHIFSHRVLAHTCRPADGLI